MRGKDYLQSAFRVPSRITPAYAGKSAVRRGIDFAEQDHPRLCGEKSGYNSRHYDQYRITPAYAGKSKQSFLDLLCIRDHPRLCGEKFLRQNQNVMDSGSPPPMRGKEIFQSSLPRVFGITPAYAGKRARVAYCVAPKGDHPRLCGEKAVLG